MAIVTGTVGAMSNKYDKFSIVVDDVWYSSKFEIPCKAGDVVSFDNGDKKWCRQLKVTSAGSGAAPSGGGGGYAKSAGAPTAAYKPAFPIGIDTKDRSIVRQNSLAHATNLYTSTLTVGEGITEEDALAIVDLARIFEDYSSGDGDARDATEELAKAGL